MKNARPNEGKAEFETAFRLPPTTILAMLEKAVVALETQRVTARKKTKSEEDRHGDQGQNHGPVIVAKIVIKIEIVIGIATVIATVIETEIEIEIVTEIGTETVTVIGIETEETVIATVIATGIVIAIATGIVIVAGKDRGLDQEIAVEGKGDHDQEIGTGVGLDQDLRIEGEYLILFILIHITLNLLEIRSN